MRQPLFLNQVGGIPMAGAPRGRPYGFRWRNLHGGRPTRSPLRMPMAGFPQRAPHVVAPTDADDGIPTTDAPRGRPYGCRWRDSHNGRPTWSPLRMPMTGFPQRTPHVVAPTDADGGIPTTGRSHEPLGHRRHHDPLPASWRNSLASSSRKGMILASSMSALKASIMLGKKMYRPCI